MIQKFFVAFCCLLPWALQATSSEPLIQEALQLELPLTQEEIYPESYSIKQICGKEVIAANYHAALQIVVDALGQYPDDFLLQTTFATTLGDYGETLPCSDPDREKMVQKSKEIFTKLADETEGKPINIVFYFNNERCWRLKLYKEQYENGVRRINHYLGTCEMNTYGFGGYYCQGVGAANYAKELLIAKETEQARKYAAISCTAWDKYFSYNSDYYNSYVHYALALGILGKTEEMYAACRRGADLIHKDLDYIEFKEVIDFITK